MKSVLVALIALGVLASACSGPGSKPASAPSSTSSRTPPPAVDVGSTTVRCTASDLTVVAAPTGHVVTMHERPYVIGFANQSRHACVLRGYPFVQLVSTRAPRVWTLVHPQSRFPYPPIIAGAASALRVTSVVVEPATSAYAYLAIDEGAQCGVSYAADLRVGLTRGSAELVRGINVGVCRGNQIDLSPFTAQRA